MQPTYATGLPPTITFASPCIMVAIIPQPVQITLSPIRAISLLFNVIPGAPVIIIPPICGTVPVTIGQLCVSPTVAINFFNIVFSLSELMFLKPFRVRNRKKRHMSKFYY